MMWMTNSISLRRRTVSESWDDRNNEPPEYKPRPRSLHSTRSPQGNPGINGLRSPPTPIEEVNEHVLFAREFTSQKEAAHHVPRRRRTVTSPPFMGNGIPEALPTGQMTHKDFLPKVIKGISDRPDNFRSLVQRGNSWLKDNPDLDLFSCETVMWSSVEGVPFFSDSTVITSALGGRKTKFTHGLRLWCLPKSTLSKNTEIDIKDYDVTGDHIIATLKHINDDIAKGLLQGRIMKVETNYKAEGSTADSTSWHENLNSNRKYVTFIRIFLDTNDTPTTDAEVVFRDFCPKFDACSPHNNGWQKFEDHFPTVASWATKNSCHFRFLNMQSLDVQLRKDINTERVHQTTLWESSVYKHLGTGKRNDNLNILRIAYLRHTSGQAQTGANARSRFLCKTFIPRANGVINDLADVTDKHYEELRSLVARVKQWLETSGAVLQHIETIAVPYKQTGDNERVDPDLTFSSSIPVKNVPCPKVICLRLYTQMPVIRNRRDSQTQTMSCSSDEDDIHL